METGGLDRCYICGNNLPKYRNPDYDDCCTECVAVIYYTAEEIDDAIFQKKGKKK